MMRTRTHFYTTSGKQMKSMVKVGKSMVEYRKLARMPAPFLPNTARLDAV